MIKKIRAIFKRRGVSIQSRIALYVIASTTLLTLLLCATILIVFKLHTDKIDPDTIITLTDVQHLFIILLRVCCVGCFFTLLMLFAISREIAYRSTKPIRDIISITNTITHHNLHARIPLPTHKDELYQLAETMNNLLERMEYAVEREKSFTSYASHEFRTPLAVLKGTMEVLVRKPRTEAEYSERITACIKEVDKLNDMVEQMLILTRYEEGKSSLNYANHSVEDMINSSVGMYFDAIIGKKIELKTSFLPFDDSPVIYTDEYSLSTILHNLIANAVKYCNEKGVIEINTSKENNYLIIEIRNTGDGIPKEELEAIFEKFYRSYSTDSTGSKGFGLGLSIVKRFCTLLNIDIEITSEEGKTTTAKLIIPITLPLS